MKTLLSRTFSLAAMLLATGCQFDAPSDHTGTGQVPVQPEWEAVSPGPNYLYAGVDSSGTPVYRPVTFIDSAALVEGDIAIAQGEEAVKALKEKLVNPWEEKEAPPLAKASGFVKNSAYTGNVNAWPGGRIPYFIGGGVPKSTVLEAIFEFNQAGGISFVPLTSSDQAYVVFVPTSAPRSFSQVGMVSATAPQTINLTSNAPRSAIIHEMCHTAGMYHEQMRPDRDTYVTVTQSGVDDSGWFAANWAKLNDGSTVGAYDQVSIMHYGSGTNIYTHANGLPFKVTMTAKNGQTLGGSTLTATDKVALWGISVSGNPFYLKAAMGGTTGKLTKVYTTDVNGTAKKWICTYDPVTGVANVTAINDDNSLGNSVQNVNVGAGFTVITPYLSGASDQCILFYSATSGTVKFYKLIPAGGAIGALIQTSSWFTGWSTIDYYESQFKRYWFFQNRTNWNVNIWAIANDGTLGANTYSSTWTGFNYVKPFYYETSPFVFRTYLYMHQADGLSRIVELSGDGAFGATVADIQLPSYPVVGMWQSVTKAYIALAGPTFVYVVDMDGTGFSTRGTPLFRVAGTSSQLKRIDAAVTLFNPFGGANGNWPNNHAYDMHHFLTYEFTNIPQAVFLATGAPFH